MAQARKGGLIGWLRKSGLVTRIILGMLVGIVLAEVSPDAAKGAGVLETGKRSG